MTTEAMISGIRSLASDPQKAPLTQEEHDALGEALCLPSKESGVLCRKCASNLPLFSLLGNFIAVEVQREWNEQRRRMGIVVSWSKRGAVSAVEWPSGYSTCRTAKSKSVDFSGSFELCTMEWVSKEKPERGMLYPAESYLNSSQMFQARVLECGEESAVSVLRERIRDLKNDTMGAEYEMFGNEDDTGKLRKISVRKSLNSRVVDTYNLGRPEQGWYFESIASWTEFA